MLLNGIELWGLRKLSLRRIQGKWQEWQGLGLMVPASEREGTRQHGRIRPPELGCSPQPVAPALLLMWRGLTDKVRGGRGRPASGSVAPTRASDTHCIVRIGGRIQTGLRAPAGARVGGQRALEKSATGWPGSAPKSISLHCSHTGTCPEHASPGIDLGARGSDSDEHCCNRRGRSRGSRC